MAIYEIEHACGHTAERQIYGTNVRGEREEQARRMANQPCAACYRATQDNKAAAQKNKIIAKAAALTEGLQVADLEGSEKQIPWASSIRAQAIFDIDDQYDGPEDAQTRTAAIRVAVRIKSASWWIDQRHVAAVDLVPKLLALVKAA